MSGTGVLGMGNPLLDISAEVGADLLEKYGVKLNNAILAETAHQPLYGELVAKYKVEYIAGGATQNSIRVAQWMSGAPAGFGAYIGCIGADDFGAQLSAAARDGVTTHYDIAPAGTPTGTCAVLVHAKERSLVANLAAAEKYSRAHWEKPETQAAIAGAAVVYSAGFFLTHAGEIAEATGKAVAARGGRYAVNLSAPFVCQFFGKQLAAVVACADFVFGNESEAAAWAGANGMEGATVEAVALAIAALPKVSAGRPRVVVITQGADATVVAEGGATRRIATPKIDSAAIVDTNGAGDAFVGGFLAFVAQGRSVDEAVAAGHWAAGHVIQRSGCTFDATQRYSA